MGPELAPEDRSQHGVLHVTESQEIVGQKTLSMNDHVRIFTLLSDLNLISLCNTTPELQSTLLHDSNLF